MKHSFCTILIVIFFTCSFAQPINNWTNIDRKFLIENLSRTRDEIIRETLNLSEAQWNFKEAADKWSINQVVEHLGIWELLLEREVSQALGAGERPELMGKDRTDSTVIAFLMEEKKHTATDYTKPFTYTVPSGLNDGKNNLAWLLKMRNEGIGYIDSTEANLRVYFLRAGRGNVHQVFITNFAHTDRHLRQIRRVKSDPNFPKK